MLLCQTLLRGNVTSAFFPGGLEWCSIWSWVILLVYLILTGLLVNYGFHRIIEEQDIVTRNGHPKPFTWTRSGFNRFTCIIFVAGILCGSLGIAGGLLIGPILIQMKMDPRISTSTSNFMGMWTALSTGTQ